MHTYSGCRISVKNLKQLDPALLGQELRYAPGWMNIAINCLSLRRSGTKGKLLSWIAGTDQKVWWVKHSTVEISIYSLDELDIYPPSS